MFKFVGPAGILCKTSKCGLHWALLTPCEFDTFTFSAPVLVNNMYSSSGFITCSFTSMKISKKQNAQQNELTRFSQMFFMWSVITRFKLIRDKNHVVIRKIVTSIRVL